jgi:hypothetical protein
MKFKYSDYERLINHIKKSGYRICSYSNYNEYKKPCILRHDVDFSLEKALEFAKYENQIIKESSSTYFVLVSGKFYNIFSEKSEDILKEIISMGFEIGLHFDETKYVKEDRNECEVEDVVREKLLLEEATNSQVNAVSMHRPSKNILENDIKFEGLVNSYSKEFFNNFKYISDSRMYWRENPMDVISSNKFKKLHILTHPFWYENIDRDMAVKMKDFLSDGSKERYQLMKSSFTNLNEIIDERDFI